MTIFKRGLALAGMVAFAAACGGGDAGNTDTSAPATPATEPAVTETAPATTPAAAPATSGTVHEVVANTTQNGASGVFEPATLTVKQGDVIRWTGKGAAVHNISFPASENPGKSGLPADSPFLADGQTYELQVTMAPGTYKYICTPHAALGMVGTITVE